MNEIDDKVDISSRNETGHLLYPKLVYPNGASASGVIVNNINQELIVMGNETKKEDKKEEKKSEPIKSKKDNW